MDILIPIKDFTYYLSSVKYFTLDQANKYAKDIYGIKFDFQEEEFFIKINCYDKFKKENEQINNDDGSRKWFNSTGKKIYTKFANLLYGDIEYDFFFPCVKTKIIHHIYPLVFSHDNSIDNLVYSSSMAHDILHKNPKEDIRQYNYQAIDYLWYLCNRGINKIFENYNIKQYLSQPKLASKILIQSIEYEMDLFYESII